MRTYRVRVTSTRGTGRVWWLSATFFPVVESEAGRWPSRRQALHGIMFARLRVGEEDPTSIREALIGVHWNGLSERPTWGRERWAYEVIPTIGMPAIVSTRLGTKRANSRAEFLELATKAEDAT